MRSAGRKGTWYITKPLPLRCGNTARKVGVDEKDQGALPWLLAGPGTQSLYSVLSSKHFAFEGNLHKQLTKSFCPVRRVRGSRAGGTGFDCTLPSAAGTAKPPGPQLCSELLTTLSPLAASVSPPTAPFPILKHCGFLPFLPSFSKRSALNDKNNHLPSRRCWQALINEQPSDTARSLNRGTIKACALPTCCYSSSHKKETSLPP